LGFIGSTCTALPKYSLSASRMRSAPARLVEVEPTRQGLTLVHVRAQLEQLLDTFNCSFGLYGGQRS